MLLRGAAPGEIPEDCVEPGVVHVLHVPTSIEAAGMFLPSDKAAVQVNQSAAGFLHLLASLRESCQHPMTPRIEAEPIPRSPAKWRNAHRAEGGRWLTIQESLYQYYTI